MQKNHPVVFVSFSGIDGSGKSTQIGRLHDQLCALHLRVLEVTFWTDVAALRRYRERLSHRIFKGDRGVGSPARPVSRRDKNIRGWYLTAIRCCFYLLDVIKLKLVASEISKSSIDMAIFDRYIYDELANLPLERPLIRRYAQVLLKIGPKPDLAFLLNADPVDARTRKPEYPAEFLKRNRASFLELASLAGMTVIDPSSVSDTGRTVEAEVLRTMSSRMTEQAPLKACAGWP